MNHAPVHLGPRRAAGGVRRAVRGRHPRRRSRVGHELVLVGRRAAVRRRAGDPHRPAARRAGLRRRRSSPTTTPCELLMSHHHTARRQAGGRSCGARAGLDIELPALDCYGAPLDAMLVETGCRCRARRPRRAPRLARSSGSACSSDRTSTRIGRAPCSTPGARSARRAAARRSCCCATRARLLPLDLNDRSHRGHRPGRRPMRGLRATTTIPRTPRSCTRSAVVPALLPQAGGAFQPGPHYTSTSRRSPHSSRQ